jgi:hypothetical protein
MYNSNQYRQGYKPVTAYTVTQPVKINGTDINTGLYPVLNYFPSQTFSPYIYVPIAVFNKVGANVSWDDRTQTLSVTTDYYQILRDNLGLRADITKLSAARPEEGD